MAKLNATTDPESRRQAVSAAFSWAWDAYVEHAWGHDELRPFRKDGTDWLHLGLSIFDALDTSFIMNNMTIFNKAAEWVKRDFKMHANVEANVFETTIRVLGGSLSAYHLSKDPEFLRVAQMCADRLMPAFQASPSKIPYSSMNFNTSRASVSNVASTAEATTLQLEFKYLSQLTGNVTYWNAAEEVMRWIDEIGTQDGLVPIYMNANSGQFQGYEIRLGSRADSFYGR
jgi:mannosyl-oligosaccharide alpha-1,2-mannosidase